MTYHQITSSERYTIAAMLWEGHSYAEIGRRVGRPRGTIHREVARNRSSYDGAYRADRAIERASGVRSRSRRGSQFDEADWGLIKRLLGRRWSPEQISGRLRREGRLSISHETIYLYIWRDKAEGGELYKCLRSAQKLRRKRHNSRESRGRVIGKRHISERPAAIDRRGRVGHWEIDTVMGGGSKDCLLTVVERKTGYALVGKLRDRSKASVNRRLCQLMGRCGDRFRTITADNGTEFHGYESVEARRGVRFYFATPYHSWERGSNENFNGLLRQYAPKRKSQAKLTQHDCNAYAKSLNTRPRKRLGYRTPEECFHGKRSLLRF